jgi:hypothetical protein
VLLRDPWGFHWGVGKGFLRPLMFGVVINHYMYSLYSGGFNRSWAEAKRSVSAVVSGGGWEGAKGWEGLARILTKSATFLHWPDSELLRRRL